MSEEGVITVFLFGVCCIAALGILAISGLSYWVSKLTIGQIEKLNRGHKE